MEVLLTAIVLLGVAYSGVATCSLGNCPTPGDSNDCVVYKAYINCLGDEKVKCDAGQGTEEASIDSTISTFGAAKDALNCIDDDGCAAIKCGFTPATEGALCTNVTIFLDCLTSQKPTCNQYQSTEKTRIDGYISTYAGVKVQACGGGSIILGSLSTVLFTLQLSMFLTSI